MILLLSWGLRAQDLTISGNVSSMQGCAKKVMVWLSLDKDNFKERLLLMHTEVPSGGTFSFYVNPGDYQVRASDESGCEYFKRVNVKKSVKLSIKMERK